MHFSRIVILRTALALLTPGVVVGCATVPKPDAGSSCAPPAPTPLGGITPARVLALAGQYTFTLVALDGPDAGAVARGTLTLVPTDTLHRLYETWFGAPRRLRGERPLRGWAEVQGKIGLQTAGTPLDSKDPDTPGVIAILDGALWGLTLRLGDRPMLDGGFNELTVTEAGDQGFAGRWRSSLGYTTYHAGGYFCARRIARG